MRRFAVPIPLFAVALVAVALVVGRPGPGAGAQAGTPALTGHPLVGAWLLDTDTHDPANAPSLAIFSADGTYLQSDPDGSNGVGTWTATGPRSADLTALFLGQENGAYAGTAKVRASVDVDASGDALTASYTIEFVAPDGTSSGQQGPGMAGATRIAVEPMGTPVGPMIEGSPGAGTPTP